LVGWGEHGFSVFIESPRGNYLFDTGNGHGIVANSLALSSMDVLEVYWKFKKEEL
jgi:metal-dependent hydrolase (beta-lactamase superfamily II)